MPVIARGIFCEEDDFEIDDLEDDELDEEPTDIGHL